MGHSCAAGHRDGPPKLAKLASAHKDLRDLCKELAFGTPNAQVVKSLFISYNPFAFSVFILTVPGEGQGW